MSTIPYRLKNMNFLFLMITGDVVEFGLQRFDVILSLNYFGFNARKRHKQCVPYNNCLVLGNAESSKCEP